MREYVRYWAELTGAERIEVVSAADNDRRIQWSLDAGELLFLNARSRAIMPTRGAADNGRRMWSDR